MAGTCLPVRGCRAACLSVAAADEPNRLCCCCGGGFIRVVTTATARLLDEYVGRFQPSGTFTTLDDTRQAALIILAFTTTAPVQVLIFTAAFAINGEPAMLTLSLLVLLVDLIALPVLVATGSMRAYSLLGAWRLVIAGIIGHLLLGGFLWSGGYLLFGALATLIGVLSLRVRDTVALGAVTITAALVFAPLEGWLRGTREAPALGLSVFILVSLGVVTVAWAVPLTLLLGRRLQREHDRNRELMLAILPETVADRLMAQPGMIADRHDGCTIVFADLVGFTAHSKGKDAEQIVGELNTVFSRFDTLTTQHGAEKIKTIGDGYMAAAGLPDPDPDHVAHACDLALAMVEAMPGLNTDMGTDFALRVGVHTGPAVAGVVGTSKFAYDVWGDTVNLASRLESTGTPGLVVTSAAVAAALNGLHHVEPVGVKDLKGQGPTEIYRLTRTDSAAV